MAEPADVYCFWLDACEKANNDKRAGSGEDSSDKDDGMDDFLEKTIKKRNFDDEDSMDEIKEEDDSSESEFDSIDEEIEKPKKLKRPKVH